MKQTIYNLISEQTNTLSVQQVTTDIVVAAAIGLFIFLSYVISHRGTIYSKKFGVSLVVLTTLTATVMTVIGNNIALSLGMVGALSIVRFRTAIKDSRDTVYIFWTVIVGICCGVGDFIVAGIGSAVVFVLLLVLGAIKSDTRMLLIIRGSHEQLMPVQALIFKLFDRKAVLRVRNTTDETFEVIYEISRKMLNKAENDRVAVTDAIYAIGRIEYVNIVMQNDDIYN